jgi:hypothetical protein
MGSVKPVPRWLPGAASPKWHSRRSWDQLGYLRVRSLGNPHWRRDIPWLIGVMTRGRPAAPGPKRDTYDRALAAVRTYRREPDVDEMAREMAWDAVLGAIDDYLELVQREHLDEVRKAGRS